VKINEDGTARSRRDNIDDPLENKKKKKKKRKRKESAS